MINNRIFDNIKVIMSPLSGEINGFINGITTKIFLKNEDNSEFAKDILINMLKDYFPDCSGIVWGEQVHSTRITNIDSLKQELSISNLLKIKQCDGFLTSLSKVLLCVFTADCVPISYIDEKSGYIGIAHSGWKGTYDNIAGKMVNLMKKQGASARTTKVWIGPSIGHCCYEVSDNLLKKFDERFNSYDTIHNNRYLNLQNINRQNIILEGIPPENIYVTEMCTKCNSDIFFSYRKQPETTGRMCTFIMKS